MYCALIDVKNNAIGAFLSTGNFLQINLTDHFVQGIYVTFAQLRPTHMCDDQNANDVADACVGVQVLNSDFMCTSKDK